jgi:hypothetical protein
MISGHQRGRVVQALTPAGKRRLNEDDRYTLIRYAHFGAAAEYVAAAFAAIPTVRRVALFGSVASSPRTEFTRARGRRGQFHAPKDVDLAVWLMIPPKSSRTDPTQP